MCAIRSDDGMHETGEQTHIDNYVDRDALKRELVVAFEKLRLGEQNCLEFAETLGRAKEIYEQLNPDTRNNESTRPVFLDLMASILKRPRSSLDASCYIYNYLRPEARDLIRTHKIAD